MKMSPYQVIGLLGLLAVVSANITYTVQAEKPEKGRYCYQAGDLLFTICEPNKELCELNKSGALEEEGYNPGAPDDKLAKCKIQGKQDDWCYKSDDGEIFEKCIFDSKKRCEQFLERDEFAISRCYNSVSN